MKQSLEIPADGNHQGLWNPPWVTRGGQCLSVEISNRKKAVREFFFFQFLSDVSEETNEGGFSASFTIRICI